MINLKKLKSELWNTMTKFATLPRCGFPEDEVKDYFFIDITNDRTMRNITNDESTDDDIIVEVRAELGYDSMIDLSDELDKVIRKYDNDAYFEMYSPGVAQALIYNSNNISESTAITSSHSPQDLDYWIKEYEYDYASGKSLGDIWDEVFDATGDEALADDIVTELEDTVEVYDHYYE